MLNLYLKDKTVLIVDDVEVNRSLFGFYLQNSEAELLYANNGKEAVDICNSNPNIDLILMDIQMPVLNGIEATRQIRKFNKKSAIIAVTAYAYPGDKESCVAAGCNDFVSKPIDTDLLHDMIESILL